MRPSSATPTRVQLGFATLAATACALAVVGSAPASYPARAQRLLVKTESTFGSQVTVLDERGHVRSRLGIVSGSNGVIAVSRSGTQLAHVQTLAFDLPPDIPRAFRQRLERRPQSTLEFDSFLQSTRVGGGSSYSVIGRPIPALGRPAWAPGGRRVAISQAHSGDVHLYLLKAGAERAPRQLTHGPGRDLNPRWSPNGSTIVFERRRGGEIDLYAVRPNGTGLRLLVGWPSQETSPDFAPDGRWLVFSSNSSGRFQLYVVPAEGGPARRLTDSTGNDTRPVWSPDGRWIAFSSDRDDDNDVFLIDPKGESDRKLTHNATEDLVQDWQPLRDAQAPTVRALPSSSVRGGPARLRFMVRDASPRVRVVADLELTYDSPNGRGLIGTGNTKVFRTGTGNVRVLTVSIDRGFLLDEAGADVLSRARFCVQAVDLWGNTSRESCAIFRFH